MLKGTSTNQAAGAITTYTARTVCASWLARPTMESTRKHTTAPSQPTDAVICAVSTSFVARGVIIGGDRDGADRRRRP